MKEFQKKRLLKLADFLEQLPPKKFDLHILGDAAIVDGEAILPSKKALELSCDTTGCAMGWCPVVFPRNVKAHVDLEYLDPEDKTLPIEITFDGVNDFDGAVEFFGLVGGYDDSAYLFGPYNYPRGKRGAKQVAARIRHYVSVNGNIKRNTKAYYGTY